ncbi:MAG: FAD-dependent oxidoreductase [Candidatus Limiplasma sp.]|nr:FAD-dependent oxidoreductase [Candidatus Limiplasma sp.]
MYRKLTSPVSIGSLCLHNRVVMPAMGVNLSARDGGVSEDIIAYYEARARGGVGLIITEITRVADGAGAGEPCQLAARSVRDIPDLQRLVDAVHKYDAKLFFQLQHPGAMASPAVTGVQPVAPSPLPWMEEGAVRVLSTEECGALVQAFVDAARVVQMAGADGVELHGAHGYLVNEFLSPAMNRRTDAYGGSFEGRMRFAVEVLQGIRAACGPHFPISVRINAQEDLPGGADLEEAQRIAVGLERAGADAIDVSCFSQGCIEPGTFAQGWKKHMAAAVKEAVSIPVIAVCNVKEPKIAEELLAEGVCDLVGVGRGHLADPQWCNKAFEGRQEEIRRCIGCLACFEEICKLRRVRCAVNPAAGREREYACPRRDGGGRTVAVVGGGPAGMEAALVLKARGFFPVILEEEARLGGALNVADKGYGKALITQYADSLIAQVRHAGIEVRCGEKATVEKIRGLNPCGTFVACGGAPIKPPVEGIDSAHVCTAEEVLTGKIKPDSAVAVIGAGMTGLEAGEMLAGRGCGLTLVDMTDAVGTGMYPALVEDVMSRINPYGPSILTGHRLARIAPGRATLTRLSDQESVGVQADWVVLAVGVRPRKETVEEFCSALDNVRVIGDAKRCGRILEATQDAHAQAFVFRPMEGPS